MGLLEYLKNKILGLVGIVVGLCMMIVGGVAGYQTTGYIFIIGGFIVILAGGYYLGKKTS